MWIIEKSNLETVDYENIDLNWWIFSGALHLSIVPGSASKNSITLYG